MPKPLLLMLAVLAMAVVSCAGCAKDPIDRVHQYRATLTEGRETMTAAFNHGLVGPVKFLDYCRLDDEAIATLNAIQQRIEDGEKATDATFAEIEALLVRLAQLRPPEKKRAGADLTVAMVLALILRLAEIARTAQLAGRSTLTPEERAAIREQEALSLILRDIAADEARRQIQGGPDVPSDPD